MKTTFALILAATLAASLEAQVQLLPPDFTLFGKTSGDYCAEWHQYAYTISTNGDYLFPDASPFADERVYFLQRTLFYFPTLGVQTYFAPDDVYLYFPIIGSTWDNVDTLPPLTLEELRNALEATINRITAVQLIIDGVPLANPLGYRTESPFFSVNIPTSDNYYSILIGRPFQGLIDPMIAGGYLVMLKPLPPGLHDIRTAYTVGEPNGFTRERHFQIFSLTITEFVARQTDQLAAQLTGSSLPASRRQGLLAVLNAAKASFDSENIQAGINQLKAFQNKVRAQVAPRDPELANSLLQAAQNIIERENAAPRLSPQN